MITYEVVADVDPTLVEGYERYMRERHVPDLIATGCFSAATLERSRSGAYRLRCVARSREALDRYLRDHAPALRADFTATLPSGVRLARELWEEVVRLDGGVGGDGATGRPAGRAPRGEGD
jgi:hypothetical protein